MKPETFSISIPKDKISAMETVCYAGNIKVVNTPEEADEAITELQKAQIVGFDTETRPTFKKGKVNNVALMQISTDTTCYLFRLNKLGMIDCLKNFLENQDIEKIGLSLRDDFGVMHRSCQFEPKGFIDLQEYVRQYHIIDSSLQRIYAIIFGQRISKSQRLTNWEAKELTPSQQAYASLDAWACLKIYRYLKAGGFDPALSEFIVMDEEEAE